MQREPAALLARSGGLITRAQAMDSGLCSAEISRLLRDREWVRLRRGTYVASALWDELDPYRAQPLLRARAALLSMDREWVLSHDSSAYAVGIELPPIPDPHVHITRPGITNAWTKTGVKHHLARFRSEQVLHVGDLPCLDVARTAVDLAREHHEGIGLAACDSALRLGTTRSQLGAASEVMVSWPHISRVRRCIDRADAGAQTPLESLGRHFVWELAIGTPITQFPVAVRQGVRWCDVAVGAHVFEFHGTAKYRPVAAGGLATRSADVVLLDERKRERLLTDQGLGVTNLYYEDLIRGPRREEARRRALADWRSTVARVGTQMPERLAANAARIRGEQRAPS